MNAVKNVYLALDTSYQEGIVALFLEDQLLFSVVLTDKMAHGRELCGAISAAMEFCEQHGLRLAAIFCGLGPGSFVGVRIALAAALGFSFARNLPLMGFCSHRALAYSAKDHHDDFYIFMKASGDVGYFSQFGGTDDNFGPIGITEVISVLDIASKISPKALLFTDHYDRLKREITEGHVARILAGPSAHGVQQAALERLFSVGSVVDESSFIKPNYIKGANVSLSKKNIVIGRLVD